MTMDCPCVLTMGLCTLLPHNTGVVLSLQTSHPYCSKVVSHEEPDEAMKKEDSICAQGLMGYHILQTYCNQNPDCQLYCLCDRTLQKLSG